MLQYSKDSGDIHLFLRQARGLTPKKLQYTYTLPKKYFALVQSTSQINEDTKIVINKKLGGSYPQTQYIQ